MQKQRTVCLLVECSPLPLQCWSANIIAVI